YKASPAVVERSFRICVEDLRSRESGDAVQPEPGRDVDGIAARALLRRGWASEEVVPVLGLSPGCYQNQIFSSSNTAPTTHARGRGRSHQLRASSFGISVSP